MPGETTALGVIRKIINCDINNNSGVVLQQNTGRCSESSHGVYVFFSKSYFRISGETHRKTFVKNAR